MKEIDNDSFNLGYLAGILEGEGGFNVSSVESVQEKGWMDCTVTVTGTAPQLVRWLQQTFGGKVDPCASTRSFQWIARKKDGILPILQKLDNRLLFKRQQLDVFTRLLELLGAPHIPNVLTRDDIDERVQEVQTLRKLVRGFWDCTKAGREGAKVVVSLSGGIDSSTLLYYLKWLGLNPIGISVDYGQRHKKELVAAQKVAQTLGVPHRILDLAALKTILTGSALTDDIEVPHGHYEDETMKVTVVPNRNAILLSIMTGQAIGMGAPYIAFAAHASDSAIYPDCRPPFVAAFDAAMRVANYETVTVLAPFLSFTKADIVFLANLLQVPLTDTWSCYVGGEAHCGRCGTCTERIEAFQLAGVEDPTVYAD